MLRETLCLSVYRLSEVFLDQLPLDIIIIQCWSSIVLLYLLLKDGLKGLEHVLGQPNQSLHPAMVGLSKMLRIFPIFSLCSINRKLWVASRLTQR
jgi:hypothetical protein